MSDRTINIEPSRTCQVFDIEVEDNHNFLISKTNDIKEKNVIVHNCQDLSAVQLALLKKASNMPKRNGIKTRLTKKLDNEVTKQFVENLKLKEL